MKPQEPARNNPTVNPRSAGLARPVRGMAIMLVLLCVAAATIMAAAYAASRENTPQLSTNIVSGAASRTAAITGLQMARAVFECEDADIRSSLVNGVLFSNVPVGDGTVTVVVTAIDGTPVAQDTQYFDVKSTGSCNGMEQVAQAHAHVALDQPNPMPTFSDFALFGVGQLDINGATLTRWTQSPDAKWGAPIWIGTNSISSSKISLTGAATILDAIAQVDSDGGSAVLHNATDAALNVPVRSLAADLGLPVLAAPTPNTSMCAVSPTPVTNITSGTVISNDSWLVSSIRIANTGIVRVTAPSLITRHCTGNVTIEDGGQLIVESDHDFIIDGNLTISNGGTIQVNDGVRCRIWVGGNLTVDDAALGLSLADAATVSDLNRGLPTYTDPNKCQVYELPGSGSHNWVFDHGAIVLARAYGPNQSIRIDHASCFTGCALGNQVQLLASSALHYDPSLDKRGGYTNTSGPLYNGDGTLNTTLLASILDIGDSSLATLAGLLGGGGPVPFLFPGDPSPRNRLVEWSVLRTGIEPVKDNPDAATQDTDSGVLPAG